MILRGHFNAQQWLTKYHAEKLWSKTFSQDGVEKRLPTRLSDAVNFEHFSVNKLSEVPRVNVNRVS